MALEIDRVYSATVVGKQPLIPRNLQISDLAEWTDTINGGGVTPVYSGDDNGTGTYVCSAAGSSRSMDGRGFTLEDGKTYIMIGRVTINSGTPTFPTFGLINTSNVTSVSPASGTITTTASGLYGVAFTATADAGTTVRVGISINGALEGNAVNLDWADVGIFEYDGVNPPEFVHGFFDDGDSVASIGAGAFMLSFLDTHNTSTGLITEVLGDPSVFSSNQPFTVGVFTGDSYANQDNEWPQQTATAGGHLVLIGRAVSGEGLADFDTAFADTIALDAFPHNGILPEFVIIQGSINSVVDVGQTSVTMLASTESMIDKSTAAGILPVCTNIVSVAAVNIEAEFNKVTEYNAGLRALCAAKGALYIDVASPIADPANPKLPLAIYADGDGTHLTTAGYEVYGRTVSQSLADLRAAPIANIALSGPLTSNLTG